MDPQIDAPGAQDALAYLETELGEPAEHLRLLADIAPDSVQGYYRMWQEIMPGGLPRRYKALVCVSLAQTMHHREAAVRWSRVAVRWGLQVAELRESICFNITGQGMSTFSEIGQHCLRAAIAEDAALGARPPADPLPPFDPPAAWKTAAMPREDVPLSERPAPMPSDPNRAAIHDYFERAFNAPMPEFWARLAAESSGIFDGYVLLRRGNMRPQSEGGATPQKVKELLAVAIDTVLHNPWGGQAHLRAAMLHGATVADVRDIMGLVIMETGMVNYKMSGFDLLQHAESIAAALATR